MNNRIALQLLGVLVFAVIRNSSNTVSAFVTPGPRRSRGTCVGTHYHHHAAAAAGKNSRKSFAATATSVIAKAKNAIQRKLSSPSSSSKDNDNDDKNNSKRRKLMGAAILLSILTLNHQPALAMGAIGGSKGPVAVMERYVHIHTKNMHHLACWMLVACIHTHTHARTHTCTQSTQY